MNPSALIIIQIVRNCPNTFIQIIRHNDWLKRISYNELAMKLYLIRKAAPYPIGVNFISFSVDSNIKRFDLSVVVKGSNDRNNL